MRSNPISSDRLQAALTKRFLEPALPALEALFFEIRAETDQALASRAAPLYGGPYPYGYCLEITLDVMDRLRLRLARPPRSAGERALKIFMAKGGRVRRRWGVLRESFFQNALEAGSLYIDVSNDTVVTTKPKVEILLMADSGLAPVKDAAHFARIAERYWKCRAYVNTALPQFAPLFPIIVVERNRLIRIHSNTDDMTRLLRSDGFRRSEQWLREGPEPPAAVVAALRDACPQDILAENPETGVEVAIEACRRLRDDRVRVDGDWAVRMCMKLERLGVALAPMANRQGLTVRGGYANARIFAGVR